MIKGIADPHSIMQSQGEHAFTLSRPMLLQGEVYIVVREGDQRPGLPLWVSSFVQTATEQEAQAEHGLSKVYGQEDALMLLLNGATWKVSVG